MGSRQRTLGGDLESGSGQYNTPLSEVKPISDAVDGFDVDVCASKDSNLADVNIREEGGLVADWSEYDTVWCNHPYARGEPEKWLGEAVETDAQTVVTLSRCDTSTEYFRDYLMEADLLHFPDRIAFVGEDNGADFANVYGVFGEVPDELRAHFLSETGVTIAPGRSGSTRVISEWLHDAISFEQREDGDGVALVGPDGTRLVDNHDGHADHRIGRSSRFGNPFKTEQDGGAYTRTESVEMYRGWFHGCLETDTGPFDAGDVEALRREQIGCWCVPKLCHGMVILNYLADTST